MKISHFNHQNNEKIYLAFGNSPKSFLEIIEVGVSKNCNLHCNYCPNTFLTQKPAEQIMSMPLFEKILENLKKINFQGKFTFHRYNEPLIVNVEQYIVAAKKYLPKISAELSTNGSMLSKARLEKLQETPVDKIIVTQHTKKGFIDNLDKIPDNLLKNVDVRYGDELILVNRAGILWKTQKELSKPCYYVEKALAVNSDGQVPLCADDYYSKIVLGNLKNESLEEIWNKPSVSKLREQLIKGNRKFINLCRNCNRIAEKRQANQDLSKNNALYRKQLLINTGSAHLQQPILKQV